MREDSRARILERYRANAPEVDELLVYTESQFEPPIQRLTFPLDDEPHVDAWRRYVKEADVTGVFPALQNVLVQLRFPIRRGISQEEGYRSVTLRGISPDEVPDATGLSLRDPEGLRLVLQPTVAGTIPVLIVPRREDFVRLVQALGMRNEPGDVPRSMGATTVGGLVNWDRIACLRRGWECGHPFDGAAGWAEELSRIQRRRELYQDRLILLSTGPYSDVSARDIQLPEDEWLRLSLAIRVEHESTHYATRRIFGSMRNNAFDELIADYVGITSATGRYDSGWLLRFMGLESWPKYRENGRLGNYRGHPPLSLGAFRILQALTHDAALALATIPAASFEPEDLQSKGDMLLRLSALTLPELAASTG